MFRVGFRYRRRSPAIPAFWMALAALLATTGVLTTGCSGGARTSLLSLPVSGAARAAGGATFTVHWPARPAVPAGRLIPLAANSIVVAVTPDGATVPVATRVLARPASGTETSADFANLTVGGYTATATAYPQANGTGVAQAVGSAVFAVSQGSVTNVPLTMDSTVTSVQVAPGQRVITGKTRLVSVVAKDTTGATVIVNAAAIGLSVVAGATDLSVDSSDHMTGVTAGTASITATVDGVGSTPQTVTVMPPGFLFKAPVDYATLTGPDVFAADDIDGDGNLDLEFTAGGKAGILWGNGDGTFQPAMYLDVTGSIASGIVADVDNDGRKDLVFCTFDNNRAVVYRNLGSRTFADPIYYPVGTKAYSVTAGDFNGDGYLDLATANDGSNDVTILMNNGDGTFRTWSTFGIGSFPACVLAVDVNGDGKTDLIASNYLNNVLVLKGDGSGGFTQIGNYTARNESSAFAYADLNNDGLPDITIANTFDNSLSVYMGTGAGLFTAQTVYSGNVYPADTRAADIDGDGNLDIVTADNGVSYFSVYAGYGNGNLAPPLTFNSTGSNVRTAVVGDFDKDGMPDVAIGNESSGTITVFLNAK